MTTFMTFTKNSSILFSKVIQSKFIQEVVRFLKSGYWLIPIAWGVVVISASPSFGYLYSPDSMGYILIGNNLLSGLGYTSQAIRDFYIENLSAFSEPSRSFPPLLPSLIGIVDKIFGKGISSGLLVNIFALLALLHVHYLVSKELFGKYFYAIFLVLPFFALANNPFIEEVVSGRSIPLATLLVSCLIYLVTRNDGNRLSALFMGGTLGLLYLTRADTLIFCFLMLIYCAVRSTNKQYTFMLLAGLSIIVAPWTIRNLLTFGQFFASDNSVTALSTFQSTVPLCYFENGIPSWRDNPNLWATQRIGYFTENIKIIIELLKPFGGIYVLLIAAVGLVSTKVSKHVKPLFILTLVWLLSHTLAVSFTPFHDHRYFSVSVFLLAVCAAATIMSFVVTLEIQTHASASRRLLPKWHYLLPMLTLIISVSAVNYFVQDAINRGNAYAASYRKIYEDLKGLVSSKDRVAYADAEHLAYYSTWRTIYLPLNTQQLDDPAFIAWKTKFDVTFVLVPNNWMMLKHRMAVVVGTSGDMSLLDLRGVKVGVPQSFYLTDGNWEQGISRQFSGFFVPNTSEYLNMYIPGKIVRFTNGESRTILGVEPREQYLHVFVSGDRLSASAVGEPSKFVVLDKPNALKKEGVK